MDLKGPKMSFAAFFLKLFDSFEIDFYGGLQWGIFGQTTRKRKNVAQWEN